MFTKEEQPENICELISVTLSGIVIYIKFRQFLKAPWPILVTLLGIVILSNEQSSYLQPVITQYFVRNKSEICHRPLRVHSKG